MTKYIIISGVDGSGKTTVIEGVRAQLEAEGKTVGYIWMRYHHKLIKVHQVPFQDPSSFVPLLFSSYLKFC